MRLDDFGVDGMIYIGNFDTYMNYNERSQTLSNYCGETYSVGKKVKVVVAGINNEEHKIDLRPNNLTKREMNDLRKLRDSLVENRKKISQNAPKSDKETIFKNLKDITKAKDVEKQDVVERKRNRTSFLEPEYYSDPSSSAVNMRGIKFNSKTTSKKKSKKGKK